MLSAPSCTGSWRTTPQAGTRTSTERYAASVLLRHGIAVNNTHKQHAESTRANLLSVGEEGGNTLTFFRAQQQEGCQNNQRAHSGCCNSVRDVGLWVGFGEHRHRGLKSLSNFLFPFLEGRKSKSSSCFKSSLFSMCREVCAVGASFQNKPQRGAVALAFVFDL